MARLLAATFATLVALPAASSAFVRPGDLDTTWGSSGGVFQTPLADPSTGLSTASAAGIVVEVPTPDQRDLKVVVAGTAMEGGHKVFAVVRYNSNGTPDTTFGPHHTGVVTQAFGDDDATATSLLLLPNDFLVVGGNAVDADGNRMFALARFTKFGLLDTSFGTPNGTVLTPVGTPASGAGDASVEALSLARGSGTEMLVAGYALDGDQRKLALLSYDVGGNVDTTSLQAAAPSDDWRGFAVAAAPGGGALVAGDDTTTGAWGLARFAPDLTSLVPSFGDAGKVFTTVGGGGSAHARSLLFEQNNDLIVAGWAADGGRDEFAAARYTPAGALDPSFGSGGEVLTQVAPGNSRAGFVAESLGQLLLAGDATNGASYGFGIASYDSSGHLQPDFGQGGVVFTPFASTPADEVPRGALQPDANLVLAGTQRNGLVSKFSVARYITTVPGSSGGGVQQQFNSAAPGAQPQRRAAPRAGILIGRVRVRRRGHATVRLKCAHAASFCRGSLSMKAKRRVGRRHKLRRFKVAHVKFKVKSGRTGTLRLRLSRRATHTLARKHRLRVSARAKAKDAAGHTYRDATSRMLKTRKRHRRR